jgi:signal transduction histidine kinase
MESPTLEALDQLRSENLLLHGQLSALQKHEEALVATERKLSTLFTLLPVGISILDAESNLIYVNPALERIMRIDRADLFNGAYRSRQYLQPDGTPRSADTFASAQAIREQRTVLNVENGSICERQHQALATVEQSGRHLLSLLSSILDLANAEAGTEILEWLLIDVDILCQSAMHSVEQVAQQKGIRLLCSVDRAVEHCFADERRLLQILTHLLDNAVKFTPAGGTVGLEVTLSPSHNHIQFVVWDTGIGIADDDQARLFHAFTQGDGRLTREYGGVGLGLALVRRLVNLHGGHISLESTLGQGSRFTVTLPKEQP